MKLTFAEIARYANSSSRIPEGHVSSWSQDSRNLTPGGAYVALRGIRDGHEFLADAAHRGAVAAIVDQRPLDAVEGMTLIAVPDPLAALQEIARQARQRLRYPLIAVTGSAGKTSTKDAIASLLGAGMPVSSSKGNYNNHIGLPLSLLNLDESAGAAVLEMGMNHAGEIRMLAQLARPDIGVVTNVGTAHIENFASPEGIALAKRELIEELGREGHAVLNQDDPYVREFGAVHTGPIVTYGTLDGAMIRAESIRATGEGSRFSIRGVPFEIAIPGRHAILNVTAAVAVGSILGVSAGEMAQAARSLRGSPMRGQRVEHNGITILNDCYNSNPEAARAMLDTLAAQSGGRHIAVLGEMLELGAWSGDLHRNVGRHAAALGIEYVIGIRGESRQTVDAAAEGGAAARFFDTPEEAGAALRALARPGDVILFKGSRGTRVELALERFLAN